MAALFGTLLASKIVPTDSLDTFATHEDTYGMGSYRSVATLAERDAISAERRKEGMLVGVLSENALYQLTGGTANVNWTIFGVGGSGSKRRIAFQDTSIVTIYNVTDYQLINVWVDSPIYRPSLFNETLFGTQLFNQMDSAGAKKYFTYEVLYDIENETLIVELPQNKSGVVTII